MKPLHILPLVIVATALLASPSGAQELKKSVTWENLRAHPAPLPVIGELKSVKSDLATPSCWSVGLETMDRDYADFSKFRQYVGETGVGYGRLQSGWAKTEQKKGRYDFRWLDAHVDGLLAEGIHPWVCLCYGNPVYSHHGLDLDAKLFPDGPIMDAWLKYVRACVSRYKGKVSMWEVWNEPDGRINLDSYALYANLFVRTAGVIREVDSTAKIAAFASCRPDSQYIRQALELIARDGGIPYIDYITFHTYWPIPETAVSAVRQLREDAAAYNPSIALLQGETGCPAQLEYGHAMRDLEWTEYSQAKWDLRQAMNHWALGVPYSFFTMVDLNYGWMLQSFGLLRMNGNKEPVYKRPKFYAVQHVTSLFTAALSPVEDVRLAGDNPGSVQCVGIGKDDRTIGCVMWVGGARPSSTLDRTLVDIRIEGLNLKEPVYIDLLTGYIHDASAIVERFAHSPMDGDSVGLKGLPLWDCPIVLLERSACP